MVEILKCWSGCFWSGQLLRRLSAAVFKTLSLSMIGTSLLGGNSLFELQQTETNYWEPEKNTLQYVKHEVQTSLVEETDLKTKTMRIWCSGEVCLSGNGEERRSGESPLGRSAGLLNNKQQFFILLATRNNTAIYPTSFNRRHNLYNVYYQQGPCQGAKVSKCHSVR